MIKSDSINELAAALSKAQGSFENAIMDSVNPHFKNKYASFGAVMLAVKKGLTLNGLAIVQTVQSVDDWKLETMLIHSSGQWVAGTTPILIDKQNMQGLGSAITYAKRYAVAAMLGVVADQDDDGNSASSGPSLVQNHSAKPRSEVITDAQRKRLFAIFKGSCWTENDFKDYLKMTAGTENTAEIKREVYDEICDFLENNKRE